MYIIYTFYIIIVILIEIFLIYNVLTYLYFYFSIDNYLKRKAISQIKSSINKFKL